MKLEKLSVGIRKNLSKIALGALIASIPLICETCSIFEAQMSISCNQQEKRHMGQTSKKSHLTKFKFIGGSWHLH